MLFVNSHGCSSPILHSTCNCSAAQLNSCSPRAHAGSPLACNSPSTPERTHVISQLARGSPLKHETSWVCTIKTPHKHSKQAGLWGCAAALLDDRLANNPMKPQDPTAASPSQRTSNSPSPLSTASLQLRSPQTKPRPPTRQPSLPPQPSQTRPPPSRFSRVSSVSAPPSHVSPSSSRTQPMPSPKPSPPTPDPAPTKQPTTTTYPEPTLSLPLSTSLPLAAPPPAPTGADAALTTSLNSQDAAAAPLTLPVMKVTHQNLSSSVGVAPCAAAQLTPVPAIPPTQPTPPPSPDPLKHRLLQPLPRSSRLHLPAALLNSCLLMVLMPNHQRQLKLTPLCFPPHSPPLRSRCPSRK